MNPSKEKQWMYLTKISESGRKTLNCEPATVCLGKACAVCPELDGVCVSIAAGWREGWE